MARIRTIKPDFWQHPKVTSVKRDARLYFLGLLNEADDVGRLRYSAKRLAGVIFPDDDDVGAAEIDAWTTDLERAGLVQRYTASGASLLVVCGFTEHQSINRPSESRLPAPGSDTSSVAHAPLSEPSLPEEEQGTGNREEEQGKELVELALVPPPAAPSDPVAFIFDSWRDATGHHKAVLDKKRRDAIVRARKYYSDADLIDAAHGVLLSPHHRGENDRNTVYDDISLVLRDSKNIEFFRDLYRGEGGRAGPRLPQNAEHVRQAVAAIEGAGR